jgi:hypothetical protein
MVAVGDLFSLRDTFDHAPMLHLISVGFSNQLTKSTLLRQSRSCNESLQVIPDGESAYPEDDSKGASCRGSIRNGSSILLGA